MSYELNVNTNTTGVAQLEKTVTTLDAVTARTKQLNDALYGKTKAEEQASIATIKHATEVVKIEQLTIRYRTELAKIAEAEAKRGDAAEQAAKKAIKAAETQEQANARIGASVKNWISNPLGAAGDAAESFAVKFGAVGIGALGVATGLAVVGAALLKNTLELGAYAESVQNTSIRTGLSTTETQLWTRSAELAGVNAGTLTTAMRTLSQGLSQGTEEGKKQKKALEELGLGSDAAFRPMGELLPDIFEKLSQVGNVMERDRIAITLLGRGGLELLPLAGNVEQLQAAIKATGVIIGKDGIEKLAAWDDQARLFTLRWEAMKNTLSLGAVGLIELTMMMHGMDFGTGSGGQSGSPYGAKQRPRTWIVGDTNHPERGGRWDYGPLGPGEMSDAEQLLEQKREKARIALHAATGAANASALDSYNVGHEDPKARTTAQLKELAEKRVSAENKVRGAADAPGRQAALATLAHIDAEIAGVHALTKATAELAAAREKSHASLLQMQKSAVGQSPTAALLERFAALNPADRAAGVEMMRSQLPAAAQKEFMSFVGTRTQGFKSEVKVPHKLTLSTEGLRRAGIDSLDASDMEDNEEKLRNIKEAISTSNAAEVGRVNTEASGIRDTANRRGRVLAAGAGPGDELNVLRQQIQLRKEAAEQEFALMKAHSGVLDVEKARLRYVQEIGDLDLDYQEKILAMKRQQKEEMVSMGVGLIMAAQHGQAAGYIKSELERLQGQVLTNVARMAIDSPMGKSVTDKLHAGAGTMMGKLLEGTPFGADPTKSAGVKLDTAGDKLIIAGDKLMAIGTGGGGGYAGGYGGTAGGMASLSSLPMMGGTASGIANMLLPGYGASKSQSFSGMSGMMSGLGHTGDLQGIFTGDSKTAGGGWENLTGSERAGAAIGTGGVLLGGGMAAYSSFKKGGAQGALGGVGAIAGTAAALDPEPISKAILMGVAMGSSVISAILGDPHVKRANEISETLKGSQYTAPVAIHASMTTGGTFSDFDRFGAPRGSGLSPFPSIEQGYRDARHDTNVPGRTNSQFGPATNVTVNVQTMDSRSFNDNSHLVAASVQHAIETGKAPGLQETLRSM